MKIKLGWLILSCMILVSIVIVSCSQETEEVEREVEETQQEEAAAPVAEGPKYGGTFNIVGASDLVTWQPSWLITGQIPNLIYQHLWEGDWAKGPAGGYGTNETNWGSANNDLFYLKSGAIAESWEWTIDEEKDQGVIVWQIRQGVHFALDPDSEASRLVGGREMTADDVVYTIKQSTTDERAFVFRVNSELRNLDVTKTGPWEVTIKVPIDAMITAISRTGDAMMVYPREVADKYGDLNTWDRAVGTGPFMLTSYIAGSEAILKRNDNYWMKDPVGPGKGNQLPYLDTVRYMIIPDFSTRLAALRTGKIDWMNNLSLENAEDIRKTAPELLEQASISFQGRGTPTYMRIDMKPFSDIRVRKALMLATDFEEILQGVAQGNGQIVTAPWAETIEYRDLYVGLDDPDFPESVRELYSYNPEKAKQLLEEAGYPDGLRVEILLPSTGNTYAGIGYADYYSILKDMWAKVGIDLVFDIKEPTAIIPIKRAGEHPVLSEQQPGPVAIFHVGNPVTPGNWHNLSMIDDPIINEAMIEVRRTAIFDLKEAMNIFREKVFKTYLEQVYAIPGIVGYNYTFWWPWLKNYSGEWTIGYDDWTVATWIWIDQDLKKSMGY